MTTELGFNRRSAPYYSGNVENIRRLLSQIGVGNERLDTITEEFVSVLQGEVDDVIDNELRPMVATPLTQITRSGRVYYPGPIEFIAVRLVTYKVVVTEFTEVEPNKVSESAMAMYKDAMEELDKLKNGMLVGTNKLEGQFLKARNHYVSPTQAPSQPYERAVR